MRITKDISSPWGMKVWLEDSEFESIAEEEIQRAGNEVFVEGKGVDVETILSKGREIEPDYVELPNDVLGRTRFYADGKIEVEINRNLSDEAEANSGARHLLRTTMGHEAIHIPVHGQLHLKDTATLSLFEKEPARSPSVLCRKTTVGVSVPTQRSGYSGEWWEYQANRGMSALLMPKKFLLPIIKELLENYKFPTMEEALGYKEGERILRETSNIFDISLQVVIYRLKQLCIIPEGKQGTIELN